MAIVFADSFESGSLDLWDEYGLYDIKSTTGRDMRGDYCFYAYSGAARLIIPGGGADEMFFAARIRPAYADVYTFTFCQDSFASADRVGRVRVESNKMTAYVGTSKVATGTATVSSTVTYLIEIRFYMADSGGKIQVYVDGVLDIDYTGDTKYSTLTSIKRLTLDSNTYVDNLIIDDAALPGNQEIAMLAPNGAGTTTQWTPSTGSNYACVDEIPKSDSDYNATNVVDQIDTYAMENMPAGGVIACVQIQARMVKDGTPTPQNVNLAVRSGGTDYFSADNAVPASYGALCQVWTTNPADSAAWEKSDVDAMECGVKSKT